MDTFAGAESTQDGGKEVTSLHNYAEKRLPFKCTCFLISGEIRLKVVSSKRIEADGSNTA